MNAAAAIIEMQNVWTEVTGQPLKRALVERWFFEAWRAEITAAELRCVLEHLLAYNRKSEGAKFRIAVDRVLGDLGTFASLLGEAQATNRNRRPAATPREQVQAQRERPVDPEQASTLKSGAPAKLGDSPDFKALLEKIGNTTPAKPTGGK